MGFTITFYSFQLDPFTHVQVIGDSDDLDYIDHINTVVSGTPGGPGVGTIVNIRCQPGTTNKYTYRVIADSPYAAAEIEYNSTYCGGTPPVCDLAIVTFSHTDETDTDANNGTINMFATSSHTPIEYLLLKTDGPGSWTNSTGYFTGLEPGPYYERATDANGCFDFRTADILPFDDSLYTHYKYRLKFPSVLDGAIWEVAIYDMYNNYLLADYPKDVTGTEIPLLLKQEDPQEDKQTPIISKNITVNLLYDGLTFTTNEFTLAQERQWFIEVTRSGLPEFRGWMIPDEAQGEYADPSYPFKLTATDGLPSLKGNKFGDGSGGNGYSDSQFQQYGVKQWINLVKQCLDQLGYETGSPVILNSLQYNNIYNYNQWLDFGTWSDILYDKDGVAVDTYTALELLLKGMKMTLLQWKGRWVFINWNDLFYLMNPLKATEYAHAVYELAADYGATTANGLDVSQPSIQYIGYDQANKPINPRQTLNYDKAYNIKNKIDFTFLSLLYENPSFEFGAIEGELPPEFELYPGSIGSYYLHNVGDLAYLGKWVFRTSWSFANPDSGAGKSYVQLIDKIVIDQPNKKLNISFFWKGNEFSDGSNALPYLNILFYNNSGQVYNFNYTDTPNHWSGPFTDDPNGRFGRLGANDRITDFNAWNQFSVTTPTLPENNGFIQIFIDKPFYYSLSGGYLPPNGEYIQIDYDQLILTLSDSNDQYSLQIGESHSVTAVTGIPQANQKNIDTTLFTYPTNKRIAGNVFTLHDYATGIVANTWSFGTFGDTPNRLPATITKAFSRAYSRPMRIFEGDIETGYLTYYGIFILRFIDCIFMPFSIELDPRNGKAHIIMIEITDVISQNYYQYVPTFQRNSRQVI